MIERRELDIFHRYVGEVIMCCQCIEHDVKMIYAGMRRGDFYDNLCMTRKDTLGEIVNSLERLDRSDNQPFFTSEDYKYMRKIRNIRNYWVHNSYIGFVYEDDIEEKFALIKKRLLDDRDRLMAFHESVESVRIDVMRLFGRI